MSRMLEELHAASSLLDLATTCYLQACSAVQKSCIAGGARMLSPPELLITRLGDEVNAWKNCMTRLQDAGAAINSAQNYSKRASASALPPEILAHIFRYALAGSKCAGVRIVTRRECLSVDPEQLSHVCSSWRRAAINSSGLWIHIDLSISSRLIPRTKRYAARSGQLPIYPHIWGSFKGVSHEKDESHTSAIVSLAPRTKSIYFDQHNGGHGNSTLKTFLENCTPGALTNFIMHPSHYIHARQLILAQDQELPMGFQSQAYNMLRLDVSKQHLENIMLGLTLFRSVGYYPLWDSKAYHNLTDLRLDGPIEIPEPPLVAILRSSPQLASFEIALGIYNTITSPVEPIHLVHLEKLKTRERCPISSLLRWISPGSKPLQLTFTSERFRRIHFTPSLKEELQKFSLRSNTIRVSVDIIEHYSVLAGFFSTTGSIKELAIDGEHTIWSTNFEDSPPVSLAGLPLRLDAPYLLHCSIEIEFFLKFVEPLVVRDIFLWGCTFYKAGLGMLERISDYEFSKLCPVVRVLSAETPNPVEDW